MKEEVAAAIHLTRRAYLFYATLGAEIDYETAVPDNVRNISIKLDDETGQITSYSLNGVEIFIAKQSV